MLNPESQGLNQNQLNINLVKNAFSNVYARTMKEVKSRKKTDKLKFINEEKESTIEQYLNSPGTIRNAKIHSDANRILKVPDSKTLSKHDNVVHCPDCFLPTQTEGVVEPFSFCTNITEFSCCGYDLYCFFYIHKYYLINLLLMLLLGTVSLCYLNSRYSTELQNYCQNYYVSPTIANATALGGYFTSFSKCPLFISGYNISITSFDWLNKFSSHSMTIYIKLLEEKGRKDLVNKVMENYHVIACIICILLFITNYVFIKLSHSFIEEIDLFEISHKDFALEVQGLPKDKSTEESIKEYLKIDESVSFEDVNPTYKTARITKIRKKIVELKKLLRINEQKRKKIKGKDGDDEEEEEKEKEKENENENAKQNENEKQIEKEVKVTDKAKESEETKVSKEDLIYRGFLCFKKASTRDEIVQEINDLYKEIAEIKKNNFFNGTCYVIFSTQDKRDKYKKPFASKRITAFLYTIHSKIVRALCKCCISQERKHFLENYCHLSVDIAPEPEDIRWESLEYSFCTRFWRTVFGFGSCVLLVLASFGIVYGFTLIQYKIDHKYSDEFIENNNKIKQLIVKYILSFCITGVTCGINTAIKKFFFYTSHNERALTNTDYFLSYSIKLAILTFVNSAVIPLVANRKQYADVAKADENLVSTLLTNFITEALLSPALSFVCTDVLIKKLTQYFFVGRKYKEDDVIYEYTQRELNELYERPTMDVSGQYARLLKIVLMTFFFMPIFPLGIIFSIVGILLNYLVEKFKCVKIYKKPHRLDDDIFQFYMNHFCFCLLIYTIGNFIFYRGSRDEIHLGEINMVISAILCIVPYYKPAYSGDLKNLSNYTYEDCFFNFPFNYTILNPITQAQGGNKYFQILRDKKIITDEMYDKISKKLDKVSVKEIFSLTQKNTNFQSHLFNHLMKKRSSVNRINEAENKGENEQNEGLENAIMNLNENKDKDKDEEFINTNKQGPDNENKGYCSRNVLEISVNNPNNSYYYNSNGNKINNNNVDYINSIMNNLCICGSEGENEEEDDDEDKNDNSYTKMNENNAINNNISPNNKNENTSPRQPLIQKRNQNENPQPIKINIQPEAANLNKLIPPNAQTTSSQENKPIPPNTQTTSSQENKPIPPNAQPVPPQQNKPIPPNVQPIPQQQVRPLPPNMQPIPQQQVRPLPPNMQPIPSQQIRPLPPNIQPSQVRPLPPNVQPLSPQQVRPLPPNMQPIPPQQVRPLPPNIQPGLMPVPNSSNNKPLPPNVQPNPLNMNIRPFPPNMKPMPMQPGPFPPNMRPMPNNMIRPIPPNMQPMPRPPTNVNPPTFMKGMMSQNIRPGMPMPPMGPNQPLKPGMQPIPANNNGYCSSNVTNQPQGMDNANPQGYSSVGK